MASSFQANRLGTQKLSYTDSTVLENFPVRVRRQDSTIKNVNLMDELIRFLDKEMPEAVSKFLEYPQFKYDQSTLTDIQGFPDEARTRFSESVQSQSGPKNKEQKAEQKLKENWAKRAVAGSNEAKTVRALETLFEGRQSVLLNGVKAERILQVAREAVKFSLEQPKEQDRYLFKVPLTTLERMLAEALGFDVSQLVTQIKDLIASCPQTPSISESDMLATVKALAIEPDFNLLKDQKFLTRAVRRMFKDSQRDLFPDEVANYLTRLLHKDLVQNDDEFDILLADRPSSTFLQVEVKSYPQSGDPDETGLNNSLKKAKEQLSKGNKFFQNALAPSAQISSSWKKLNIVCFPEISSRQQFRDLLGMDENSLKFILTAEELESGKWLEDLGLPDCQAPEEEYKRLLAICVGSQHVAFNCQMLD